MTWGIPLPFDASYVTYVWFDALLNYITAAGYLSDEQRFARLWPTAVHLIGKDILITHAVYWPTMLRAIGLPQPKVIYAHGWWLVGGARMSRSLGNVARPLDLVDVYGVDAFRFYLMRGMAQGRDADFDEDDLAIRYRSALANDLGNLLHRLVNMMTRYCGGQVPSPGEPSSDESGLRKRSEMLVQDALADVAAFAAGEALGKIGEAVSEVNRYIEHRAPWSLAREGRTTEVGTVLYNGAETLRLLSVLLWPVMPRRVAELWRRLGWGPPLDLAEGLSWGRLSPGTPVAPGAPLFPMDAGMVPGS